MKKYILIAAFGLALAACQDGSVKVHVANDSKLDRKAGLVLLDAGQLKDRLGSDYLYVTDADGVEIPSQLTSDGRLLFAADIAAGTESTFTVAASDSARVYKSLVSGRIYPERADDVAWENELIGFRAYGPATQRKGERAYGYDIFFKHPTEDQILEVLYGAECDPAAWHRVDSLRAIDPALGNAYRESFSYHVDHGLGMDCYAVGPTLGAGVAVPVVNDSLSFAWCYDKAVVTDNGPLRFEVRLDFAPRAIGSDTAVTEHRIITLDAGRHLNTTRVWYDGLTAPVTMAAGVPLRDDSPVFTDASKGILAYCDPTQGADNGRAMLGVVMSSAADSIIEKQGHIVALTELAPADTLDYSWGFAWDRADITAPEAWHQYLINYAREQAEPLRVTIE
ncbi:MAG: DUF4861 domain-containing protein [Muribaculaceae bacterium]|nr:DUF4861 domain-containing protein [Muribaculaceae bacterium]